MAAGVLNSSQADFAIAATGKTPSDDELDSVICFAYALRIYRIRKIISHTQKFSGGRSTIMKTAAEYTILKIPHFHSKLVDQFADL